MENDRRTSRTKKLLADAFIELLFSKKLNEITVKELCDKADINRGTFYLHYTDIYDMKQQLENDICQQLEEIIDKSSPKVDFSTSYAVTLKLFHLIQEHSLLLKTFLGPNGDISFSQKMQTIFKERYLGIILQGQPPANLTKLNYSYSFVASGFTGLVVSWLNEENPTPVEEMAMFITKLLFNGLPSLILL